MILFLTFSLPSSLFVHSSIAQCWQIEIINAALHRKKNIKHKILMKIKSTEEEQHNTKQKETDSCISWFSPVARIQRK